MVQPATILDNTMEDSVETLIRKLNELEQRVIDAETRAEEAEDKVRIMEQRLVEAEWSGTGTSGPTESEEKEREEAISKLASQVEQQRQLRLADARQVEAKAARIKEWVTNKLKELEAQNQHLREQNHRCNQQLELLRRHMGDIGTDRVRPQSLLRSNTTASTTTNGHVPRALLENEAVYAEVPRRPKPVPQEPGTTSLGHRRHLSATAVAINTSPSQQLSDDLQAAVESLALLPVHIRPKSECMDSEQGHDYAEIYTPSTEKDAWDVGKPPTPPLHRFPSWESRIYQVASEGLAPHPTPDSSNNNTATRLHASQGYCDISVPVYATVKGRASQIRSMPFTGDSSDDSSDGEGEHTNAMNLSTTRGTNSSSDNTDTSLSSSSPSKSHIQTTSSFSPAKRSSSGSPSKSMLHTSFESGMSDDYAIPPDAVSCESLDWSGLARGPGGSPSRAPRGAEQIEKTGHLAKLGGKLKTWTRRWFQLNNAKLRYWKSQNDVNRKPQGEISIDEHCRINRAEGAATFEIATEKKTYYLTADSIAATEDWVRVLQNVQRRNATKLLLSKEHNKPTLQSWLTKVRNGHAKKCWCVLLGKMFLYFKSPSDTNAVGQINMRDARVQQVEHVSDSDSEDRDSDLAQLTIGIFPNHQPPTYLLMPSKQENDSWLYHLTVVSGAGPNAGTQYEQLVQKLMETDGDPNCVLWRHPLLLHSKETIASPLTTLSSEQLQADAIKLFKSCQLFTSVAVESAGIDYHVVLAQNALQQCLDQWELQAEMMCALVKQTSRHQPSKTGVQVFAKLRHRQLLLCATQSLFSCDGAGSPTVGPLPTPPPQAPVDSVKANPPNFALVQAWQLLALAVSLFVPKNNKLLWYLKLHLLRNTDSKTECGKYAAYCERALERTIANGGREAKPSRMEVLSILLKNPYHHSLPHSIPVHFLNGTYQGLGIRCKLFSTTKRLISVKKFAEYEHVFKEWLEEGVIEVVDDMSEREGLHYLPHHAVIKESSATSKLRPVFDASAKDERGSSLNSCLDKGPNLLVMIPDLLIRFRLRRFGGVSDIRQALRERFKTEYLAELVKRPYKGTKDVSVGDVVLVEVDSVKRIRWPPGLITDLRQGRDGIHRVAKVKTSKKVLTRPVQRLYPLEIAAEDATNLKRGTVAADEDSTEEPILTVVGFDGSTTIEEFMTTLNTEISCRESSSSGFTLFSDDPIEKDLEHYIDPQAKLCDVISKWETALREKGSGKFETTRVIQLTYKNRLYWRHSAKMETDRERLLLCYQTNVQVVQGRFPVNRDLALELAALMAQIDFGEYHAEKARGSGGNVRDLQVLQALDKFYPYRYRDGLAADTLKELQSALQEKWMSLRGRGPLDCVRIYLTCSRKWPYFGASLFQAKLKQSEWGMVWVAVAEDSITLLELGTMQPLARYPYASVLTFGGCQDDFMLVVNSDEGLGSQKLLFALSKPKILELTLLIADYMNALGRGTGTPLAGTLTRTTQPDILKATPDHQLHRTDSHKRNET